MLDIRLKTAQRLKIADFCAEQGEKRRNTRSGLSSIFNEARREKIHFEAVYPCADASKDPVCILG